MSKARTVTRGVRRPVLAYKREYGRRLRGSPISPSEKVGGRFIGIDIGSEKHAIAVVDASGEVVTSPTSCSEDAQGYRKVIEIAGAPEDALVAMEATGHYWQNLFAALTAAGHRVALLNPSRTHRFAGEDLRRGKTDAVDALSIARFAAQKRPPVTPLTDEVTLEIRELVRFRDRLVQDFGDRTRQLHRLVDLGFPEFTRFVKDLASETATAILHEYPTAAAFRSVKKRRLARLKTDGRHKVGDQLAGELLVAAESSVGAHHGEAYRVQVQMICEDLDVLRRRIRDFDDRIHTTLSKHEVGTLLTTIDGIGPNTAGRLIAELQDPARFRDAAALASYVGVVPATRHSGKRAPLRASITGYGNARLRMALWMPTLAAVRRNPWLKAYYDRLVARGKLPKVALVASMRKLLHAVYFVAKNRQPFVPRLEAVA
jgi:transposase